MQLNCTENGRYPRVILHSVEHAQTLQHSYYIIAERLSARHLFCCTLGLRLYVCMYVCMYVCIYVRHRCGCSLDIRLRMLIAHEVRILAIYAKYVASPTKSMSAPAIQKDRKALAAAKISM